MGARFQLGLERFGRSSIGYRMVTLHVSIVWKAGESLQVIRDSGLPIPCSEAFQT